jgi:hypothetical protein
MPSSAVGEGVNRWSKSPVFAVRSHKPRTEMTYLNGWWLALGEAAFLRNFKI